ncbi:Thioredoxin-related protein [Gillisia sp. Hel1_33_143]|uniref:thioredoxin family protein n=1 Tax=Gillisia sp. Hel1_33_143 TaxID=1336796 RepID=UPI0008792B43|nr:thioredoxin family protein [Gillisia sp. Hel1_33_143]SDS37626.1 Thioredoxin-related protein [Gillisia sp. Hel1_33_143]
MRKYVIFCLLLMGTTFSINAQEWQLDLKTAEETASKDHKNIILVFQGSDWCAPCMKLEKQVWSTDEFKAYAKSNFVMLKADFPKRKKNALSEAQQAKNDKLAQKYNSEGYFPLVVILNENGKVLGKTGYKNITPSEYIKHLNSFKG